MANDLIVRIEPDGATRSLKGRVAWCMRELITAGDAGVTPLDRPAPRWSDYVFKLRGMGFVIETIHEAHKGDFPGHHGRYRLASTVTVLRDCEA